MTDPHDTTTAVAPYRMARVSLESGLKGVAVALLSFGVLGTVSALWTNPLFTRMTPAGDWEIGLLALLAILFGVYFASRAPSCATKSATAGGVLGFIGVACPVCNKILLLLFGGELLLAYFEPVRIYVAAAGVAFAAWAVWRTWRPVPRQPDGEPAPARQPENG